MLPLADMRVRWYTELRQDKSSDEAMAGTGRVWSPYEGLAPHEWGTKTRELVDSYPLSVDAVVSVTLRTWDSVFRSSLGTRGFQIGTHIFPAPQIMAFLLHELIPLELEGMYPDAWRRGETGKEKDLVYLPDELYCTEIKASSSAGQIFGNRSYAQPSESLKKGKAGYYWAINFQKFGVSKTTPKITRTRLGWLDHTDWIPQRAPTGQQARLDRSADRYKLLVLR